LFAVQFDGHERCADMLIVMVVQVQAQRGVAEAGFQAHAATASPHHAFKGAILAVGRCVIHDLAPQADGAFHTEVMDVIE